MQVDSSHHMESSHGVSSLAFGLVGLFRGEAVGVRVSVEGLG